MKNKTKQFGQNFLIDKNIVGKILKYSDIEQDDTVIEIGPGKGALTVKLLNACKKLILIEIDSFLIETSLNELIKNTNAELINSDFLKLDLLRLIPENSVLIGNLPYSSAAKMIMKIAESNLKIKRCIFMIQKEMADRILAKPSSSQYNAYTVLLNLRFSPQFLFDVSPSCFYPKPQVLSSVIKLTANPEFYPLPDSFKINFSKFAHSAFANKRKTLINSVSHNLSLDKQIIIESLKKINLNPDSRAEELSLRQFIELFDCIQNYSE
ncbi:MAG TPA: 16S rRNA (adenine(1518)-N(6)/adenine(1519)-N(6))-dimethyltransferase RsmA [bacterium]|nr:16S rRNA (adenine(1518)-N(6)/adenine(1519)-N(6))-dimethyltransferase RsmA [bacterium]HPN32627.1 16S rRNA (adenine(1518)-N(6)/adenine(1519)-N(6))-dimethyltransferase RsmA [bacterium]